MLVLPHCRLGLREGVLIFRPNMKARKEVLETWESPTTAVLQHQRINTPISTHDQVSLKGCYTTAFPVKRVQLQRPLELRKASEQAG